MKLDTTYLGMPLHSPLVVSASPLSANLDNLKRMEAAGAGAIVLFSLFEEQIRMERQLAHIPHSATNLQSFYSAQYGFRMGLAAYLEHIRQAKQTVSIPIIASLNCTSLGNWTDFAHEIERAGADALELNIYFIPTSVDVTGQQIEDSYLHIFKAVKSVVNIPVAVKLTPFFTNLAILTKRLDDAGANGLVLFNLFYGPDFDPQTLSVRTEADLSAPQSTRLVLHWIAMLHRRLRADLAASTGLYTVEDVIKMLMVGAKVTMFTSALLKEGIEYLKVLSDGLLQWLAENDYQSIADLQGIVTQYAGKDSSALARTQYMKAITSLRSIL